MAREKSIEFGEMCIFGLRIAVPNQGPSGPLRPHERVLATNEIQVACPKELVVVVLRDEGNVRDRQTPAAECLTRTLHAACPRFKLGVRDTFRNDAEYGRVADSPCIEQ